MNREGAVTRLEDYKYREKLIGQLKSLQHIDLYEASTRSHTNHRMFFDKLKRCKNSIADKTVILLVASNSVDWIIVFIACMLTGKRLYAIDAKCSENDIIKIKKKITPDCIIAEKRIEGKNIYTFDDIYDSSIPPEKSKDGISELVLFTTGTTGVPKGVKISLKNILTVSESFQRKVRFSREDHTLLITPFSHVMGFIMMFNTICYSGHVLWSSFFVTL